MHVMSDVQRIETGVLYILVDVDMYEDECSVSVGTVRFASRENIIDGYYDSLFAERPSSIEGTIVPPTLLDMVVLLNLCIKKKRFINNCCCILMRFVLYLCLQPCAYMNSSCWLLCNSSYRCLLSTEKECGDYH